MSRYVDENSFPLDGDCESEHTLSDNEIIKALECCCKDDVYLHDNTICNGCPLYGDDDCTAFLRECARDLINHQKEEIERLRRRVKEWRDAASIQSNLVSLARVVAIKEFADKLRTRVSGVGTHSAIDCVLKEMVGDDE